MEIPGFSVRSSEDTDGWITCEVGLKELLGDIEDPAGGMEVFVRRLR